jgi:hypothetical protein
MVELPQLHQPDPSDEVAPDAVQLVTIATFNGMCRLITALAENGLLTLDQLRGMHDAITYPLDDEDWRDDETVSGARDAVERVLSSAMKAAIE